MRAPIVVIFAFAAGCSVPHTRYRVGDSIVYRYTGTFTPAPVLLRERVLEQDGDRLTFDVVAERGGEQRHWIQVVTDTPENERANVVDELYEVLGSERRRLENAGNRDLGRLYEWTFIEPDGKPTDVKESRCMVEIAGRAYEGMCTTGRNKWHRTPVAFETWDSKQFLWTHGPARFWEEATGADVLRAEVESVENGPR